MKFIHHSRLSCFVASGNGIEGWLGGGGGSNLIGWAVLDSDGHGSGDEAGNGEFHLFRFFLI